MRFSLEISAAIALAVGSTLLSAGQRPSQLQFSLPGGAGSAASAKAGSETTSPGRIDLPATNPIGDPRTTVIIGDARLTVLTPQLIRLEWAAHGKFKDHASMVFIHRNIPIPKFE